MPHRSSFARALAIAAIVLAVGAAGTLPAAAQEAEAERVSAKYLPDAPGERVPLIVLLHGYGQTVQSLITSVPVLRIAQEEGWYLIAPSGRRDAREWRYWDATPTCCGYGRRFSASPWEDLDYLRGILRREFVRHPEIDRERVIVVGLSNGGFMAYQMACHASDLVAGVVAISASEQDLVEDCDPDRPVSVFHIHGRYDRAVYFAGGVVGVAPEAYAPYPSARETVQRWSDRNRCPVEASTLYPAQRGTSGGWINCAEGTEVRFRWLPDPHAVAITEELLEEIRTFMTGIRRGPAPIR